MSKNKIATRLSLYFLATLIAFTIVIGGLFFFLFQNFVLDLNQSEMERRATRVAVVFSEWMESPSSSPFQPQLRMQIGIGEQEMGMGKGALMKKDDFRHHGSYLRSLDDPTREKVWVIDSDKQLITSGQDNIPLTYRDLPADADKVVQKVFKGNTVFSRDFSPIINMPTLTVGTPIKNKQNQVIGAVLIHRPIAGIDDVFEHGILLLGGSMLVALILSLGVSIILSYRFTQPLKKMKDTALELAKGNYEIKNHLTQTDEIGQLGDAMDLLSTRLLVASKEKEKLDRFRNNFFINISHELRTPITVIRGSLEALVDKVISKPEQVEEYHEQMLKESILLQRLTGDLLEISKLQNDDFSIDKEEINLWDPLDDAIRSAHSLSKEKRIIFNIQRDGAPYPFLGDYGRLRQLFLIVLDNAVKFSPADSKIDIIQEGNHLRIRDYGKGIPEKDLPYIFDRFYQSSIEDSELGSGLGLAIAKQIARHHDIQLTASIIPSESGAQFEFFFPSPSIPLAKEIQTN